VSIIFYWGDDDFAIDRAVKAIDRSSVDPAWASFNYQKITPDLDNAEIFALDTAMTPPFGTGKRLVWLADTTICQQCSEDLLAELERTLPNIPATTQLLLTSKNKPDGRLKSTKLIQKFAKVEEFSAIPPWKTEELIQKVRQAAAEMQLKITQDAITLLAESVGNNTRQLHLELEKLQLFIATSDRPIDLHAVSTLVIINTQNSLQLATALRDGDVPKSLSLIRELIDRNEPALKIVATLVGQFRTWLLVKVAIESGDRDDKSIASFAGLSNPKRLYFIKQELQHLNGRKLAASLPILRDLEFNLKRGGEPISTLQKHAIELCQLLK
jgi:DNA polymerase III subunit delta